MNVEPVNPSPESQSLWYYADAANQPVGPLPFSDLQQLAAAGVIQPETHIIEEGGTEWKKFASIIPLRACTETKPASADIPLSSAAVSAKENAADRLTSFGKTFDYFSLKCERRLKTFAVIAADKSKLYWKKAEEFFDNYKRGLEAQANKRSDTAVPEPGEQPTEKKQPTTKETVQGGASLVPLATEAILYSDPQLTVTSRRVIIGETTYSLRNITSVTMKTTTPNGCCAGLLILFGGVGAFAVFSDLFTAGKLPEFSSFFLIAVFLVAGIAWFRSLKPSFHVTIASASGEVEALESAEKDYIQKIVTSINDAVANHHS